MYEMIAKKQSSVLAILCYLSTAWFLAACDTELEVKTKYSTCKDNCPKILQISPLVAVAGETLKLIGANFVKGMQVDLNGSLHQVEVISDQEATIINPEGNPGEKKIAVVHGNQVSPGGTFFHLTKDYPLNTSSPESICAGEKYYDRFGVLQEGKRKCSSTILGLKPDIILEGYKVAGVIGGLRYCTKDGQENCVNSGSFKAAFTDDIADKIITGKKIAGIEGTAPMALPPCTKDGDRQCSVDGITYKAVLLKDLATKVRTGHSVAGVAGTYTPDFPDPSNVRSSDTVREIPGTLTDCSSNGAVGCIATSAYPAVSAGAFIASNIKTGVVIGSTTGTYGGVGLAPECQIDGEIGCTTSAAFPAISKNATNLAFKIKSGEVIAGIMGSYSPDFPNVGNVLNSDTVNGISGTLTLPPAGSVRSESSYGVAGTGSRGTISDCTTNSEDSCYLNPAGAYDAADLASLAPENIRSGVAIAGTSGNLTLPAANDVEAGVGYGSASTEFSGTFTAPTPGDVEAGVSYGGGGSEFSGSFSVPAISNVALGISYGDLGTEFTGTADIETHSDCAADGATGCVATSTYSAALTTGLADKVLSGQTVAGTPGNVTLPAEASVRSGVSYGVGGTGSTGVIADCSSNSEDSCYLNPAGAYDAADLASLAPGNIRSGVAIAGTSGNLTLPAASDVEAGVGYGSAGTEFSGTFTAPAPGDVEVGVSYGSAGTEFSGTFTAPAPGDVEAGVSYGSAGTEFSGTFTAPAPGDVEAGVSYGGGGSEFSGSFSVPAISNVALGISYGDLGTEFTGTADIETHSDCAADGATGCVATSTYSAALTTGLADKVLSGQTVAGTPGNVTLPAGASVRSGVSYGVGGTGSTGVIADCSSNSEDSCYLNPAGAYDAADLTGLASENIKSGVTIAGVAGSINISNLNAGNIKNGVAINGVLGTYPSATTPLAANTAAADLTSLGGGTPAGDYEFFDSAGNVYSTTVANGGNITASTSDQVISEADTVYNGFTVVGDPDLVASNIKVGITLLGIGGIMVGPPANCASNGEQDCVATGAFQAAAPQGNWDITDFFPGPGYYTGISNAPLSSLRSTASINGVAGSISDCSINGSDCYLPNYVVLSQPLKAIDYDAIDNAKMLTTLSIGGITGIVTLPVIGKVLAGTSFGPSGSSWGTLTLPAAANVRTINGAYGISGTGSTPTLANCNGANQSGCVATATYATMNLSTTSATDLTSSNFTTAVASASTYEFWDSNGSRHTVSGDSDLSAGNIKSQVVIHGITGQYPSSSYRLPSASGLGDLKSSNFLTRVKSSSTFEYWSSDGSYHTSSGDADIVASNIVDGVNIFGVSGTVPATPSGYRYWRLNIKSIYGTFTYAIINELEFKINGSYRSNSMSGSSSGTVAGYSGVTVSASSYYGTFYPWQAFSGSTVSRWDTDDYVFSSSSPYNGNEWLKVDFGTPVEIEGYRHHARDDDSCPDNGWLEYSSDNSTWTKATGSDLVDDCYWGGWINDPDF